MSRGAFGSVAVPRADFVPADHNLITWAYDPIQASSASSATNGQLQLIKVHVPAAATVTNVLLSVAVAGTSMTSGQNFAALYNSSRVLLSITADQSVAWATAGVQTMPLAVPQAVAAGDYYVGFWARSTATAPTFNRALSNLLVNVGYTTAFRFGVSTASLTTTAPNPAAAPTVGSVSFWAALS